MRALAGWLAGWAVFIALLFIGVVIMVFSVLYITMHQDSPFPICIGLTTFLIGAGVAVISAGTGFNVHCRITEGWWI